MKNIINNQDKNIIHTLINEIKIERERYDNLETKYNELQIKYNHLKIENNILEERYLTLENNISNKLNPNSAIIISFAVFLCGVLYGYIEHFII